MHHVRFLSLNAPLFHIPAARKMQYVILYAERGVTGGTGRFGPRFTLRESDQRGSRIATLADIG